MGPQESLGNHCPRMGSRVKRGSPCSLLHYRCHLAGLLLQISHHGYLHARTPTDAGHFRTRGIYLNQSSTIVWASAGRPDLIRFTAWQ